MLVEKLCIRIFTLLFVKTLLNESITVAIVVEWQYYRFSPTITVKPPNKNYCCVCLRNVVIKTWN